MSRKNHKWTKEDIYFINENFQALTCEELSGRMGLQISQVKNKCRKLGLKKTKESLKKIYSKSNAGHFAQGKNPGNTKHDLFISERTDHKGRRIKWIRVSLGKWELLHKYLWREAGNSIPSGHVIQFIDNNPENCKLENLRVALRYSGSPLIKPKALTTVKAKVIVFPVKEKVVYKSGIPQPRKPVKKVFEMKPVVYSDLISVKIDRRTTIYVKPGSDIDEIRKKYTRNII